jgi:hypothetical protein
MSRDEANALLALKNAWLGAVTSGTELQQMNGAVQAVADDTPLSGLDLEAYTRVVGAHANAVMALHGLIQELQRKLSTEE